jgi:diketogulonate reductase-like aldo/keto reductase
MNRHAQQCVEMPALGGSTLEDAVVNEIAKAHDKSPAQILLR